MSKLRTILTAHLMSLLYYSLFELAIILLIKIDPDHEFFF